MTVNEHALQRAVDAALKGPDVKDIRIQSHDFNVDHAAITETEWSVTVDGTEDGHNISHRLGGFMRDDQVKYKFTVQIGQTSVNLENAEINIDRGGILRTVGSVVMWLIDNWEKLPDFPLPTGPGDFYEIRKSDEIRQRTEELLDGTWEGEARFIILNIAMVAAGQQLAKSRPMFLTAPDRHQMVAEIDTNAVRTVSQEAIVSGITDRFSDYVDE